MDYKTEKQKGSVKFSFSVPKSEWEEAVNAAYIKTRGKYNIAGFRRGHAPRKFIESLYGPTVFFDEAFNKCASEGYSKALIENPDLYPVDEPKVDISKFGEEGVEFTVEVTLKPEVTLGEYKGLTLGVSKHEVTDSDVDADINRSLQAKSRLVEVTDRAALDGDTVTIDYSGSVNGEKFNGGTAENQQLTLGSHSFIPGFEEQVVGMAIGDQKDITVKFPDDYHAEDLKGKEAVFAIKLHGIKVREVPALDDKFVQDTTEYETVADYRAAVLKRLTENAEMRADSEKKNKVIEAAVENATVDVPDCMVNDELDYMLRDFGMRLAQMYGGMKIEDYFKYTGSSEDDFRKDRKEDARKNVKTRLVLEAIIKAENIEADEKDVENRIEELAAQTGKTVDAVKAELNEHGLMHVKSDATVEKLLSELVKANSFEEKAETEAAPKKAPAKKSTSKATAESGEKPAAKKAPAKKSAPKTAPTDAN